MITHLQKLAQTIQKDEVLGQVAACEIVSELPYGENKLPLYVFTLGASTPSPERPVLFITGGFHGLERIGAQLAWSLLKTTIERLVWDKSLRALMQNIRLVVIPLINPVGYFSNSRCNGNGVDLMRNAPIEAEGKVPFLLGGQNFSNRLPWYRGDGSLEVENQKLVEIFTREAMMSRCVVSLDFHSGFGMKDRLWFPFSFKAEPFDNLAELAALMDLFEQTHPYHIYQIEPQSNGYLLSGDIWDYLYLHYKAANPSGTYIPLTLEMGSWTWVRKNPTQIFSRHGVFNPMKEHRVKRTYRRHHLLFDFLLKAIHSNEVWAQPAKYVRAQHELRALERWY